MPVFRATNTYLQLQTIGGIGMKVLDKTNNNVYFAQNKGSFVKVTTIGFMKFYTKNQFEKRFIKL